MTVFIFELRLDTALAAGIPESLAPLVQVTEFTPATVNDPVLTARLAAVFEKTLGRENTIQKSPIMGSEDFGRLGLEGTIPICFFWLGVSDPDKLAESEKTGIPLPFLHSSKFAPVPRLSIRTGVKAMTAAVLELMKKKARDSGP